MTYNSKLLVGKTAFVTGSNRGIGAKIIELFAQNGANIFAHARIKNINFEKNLQALTLKYGVKINPIYFDLIDDFEIKASLKNLYKNKVGIDILVNNAGIAHGGLIQMTPIDSIKNIFQVNVFSHLLIIQNLIKLLKINKNSSIINITSIAGIDAEAGSIAYGSSKAAFIFATKVLSKELVIDCIRVNAVAPGLTDTDMADLMEHKAKSNMIQSSGMKRLASTTEIANAVLYLASDLSIFVNGQVIRVDGGI